MTKKNLNQIKEECSESFNWGQVRFHHALESGAKEKEPRLLVKNSAQPVWQAKRKKQNGSDNTIKRNK